MNVDFFIISSVFLRLSLNSSEMETTPNLFFSSCIKAVIKSEVLQSDSVTAKRRSSFLWYFSRYSSRNLSISAISQIMNSSWIFIWMSFRLPPLRNVSSILRWASLRLLLLKKFLLFFPFRRRELFCVGTHELLLHIEAKDC